MNTETKNKMNKRICNDFIKDFRASKSGKEQNELAIEVMHVLLKYNSIEELIEKCQTDALYNKTLCYVMERMPSAMMNVRVYCHNMANYPSSCNDPEEAVFFNCCTRAKSWNETTFCRLYENLKFLAINNKCKIEDLFEYSEDCELDYPKLKVSATEEQIQLYNNWKEYWKMIWFDIDVEAVFGCPKLTVDENYKICLKK